MKWVNKSIGFSLAVCIMLPNILFFLSYSVSPMTELYWFVLGLKLMKFREFLLQQKLKKI